jgi:hypothetical protein
LDDPNPTSERPTKVRPFRTCRGLRAWRAPKEALGTGETLKAPAALTARAKRESQLNDKKRGLEVIRESDQPIVAGRNPNQKGEKRAKELTQ